MKKQILACGLLLSASTLAITARSEVPDFINLDANMIEGSLPKFHSALAALENGGNNVVNILHIGDSHIQAEFVTDRLRDLLQERYGNAGRGLMVPLRLAGTNQSHSYSITADHKPVSQTRLLKFPWPAKPGVTGIAVICDSTATYTVSNPGNPFNAIKFISSNGVESRSFDNSVDSASVTLPAGTAFYGAVAHNGKPGIIYSAIGNNGACFTDYSLIENFPQQTALFTPDLIIISMGTNEGFSKMTDEEINKSVKNLIRSVRAFNPNAEMLILTPMECQKNRNHGKKPLSEFYDINTRVLDARQIILDVARQEQVPVWDFFTIAGGNGASAKWLDAGLMNKDRIHLVKSGYNLQGELLFDALTK